EVDGENEIGRLQYRQLCWVLTPEHATNINARLSETLINVGTISGNSARDSEGALKGDCGKSVQFCYGDDLITPPRKIAMTVDEHSGNHGTFELTESRLEFAFVGNEGDYGANSHRAGRGFDQTHILRNANAASKNKHAYLSCSWNEFMQ